ncbi:MAG: energy-coupling factor transporter transmembrane protein EcfT [Eubacterium sp.]|nr:energy-coupling factor transporter transmembrane protein EcfT [Eubacterium sp.]
MKQLPTGMYQQGNSVIHKLNSTVKVLLLIILLAAVVAANTLPGYGVLIVFTAVIVLLSHIGIKSAIGGIVRMIWFFIIIFIMNLCFFQSENAWITFWIFSPSYDGMMQGIKVVVRVAVIMIFCNILNVTTPPVEITRAMENMMSPLRIIRVPTHQLALILSVAIQFIPTLFEEADMIKKAQTARGARFDSRKFRDKAGAVIPMVVPIFISAFRRADELSLAMEARGCRVDVRQANRGRVHIGLAEIMAILICTALLILQIILL